MLPDIDPVLLSVGFVAVAAIGLVFGAVLDAVIHENGFGPTGNAVLFAAGFFGAVCVARSYGMGLADLKPVAACGFGGAFALFSVLALLKAGLARR
ncbi:hypothetical protein ACTDI4_21780 [Mesorhizobium sp. PUT5]|uniref:hypothetical protein n=1 Tax=Mesorhizobium sp. PUT5 TaxID=3454629 RepID=UPI003FA4AA2C